MHKSSMLRMQWFKNSFLSDLDINNEVTILDVGSQSVANQKDSYKVYFDQKPFKYVGLDMAEGYNVDIAVKNAYKWDEVSNHFCDVIITGQTFEHIEFPWLTIEEMARVLKPGGLICIIVPSMQKLHRYPVNCQNYFSDGLIALARYVRFDILHVSTNRAPIGAGLEWYNMGIQDTMMIAKKPNDWAPIPFDKSNYVFEVANLEDLATGLVGIEQQECFKVFKKIERKKAIIKLFPKLYSFFVSNKKN